MEQAKFIRYKKLHVISKILPQYQIGFTRIFDSTFRPLPQTEASEQIFIEHQYGFDTYWEDHIYDQDIL